LKRSFHTSPPDDSRNARAASLMGPTSR
jgi:hypothetical protein